MKVAIIFFSLVMIISMAAVVILMFKSEPMAPGEEDSPPQFIDEVEEERMRFRKIEEARHLERMKKYMADGANKKRSKDAKSIMGMGE